MGKSISTALRKKIDQALDSIRPYLEADGGDAKILDLSKDMVLTIEFTGACGTCPMSTMTLKAGVEEAIKRAVPEIKVVKCINLTAIDDPDAKMPQRIS